MPWQCCRPVSLVHQKTYVMFTFRTVSDPWIVIILVTAYVTWKKVDFCCSVLIHVIAAGLTSFVHQFVFGKRMVWCAIWPNCLYSVHLWTLANSINVTLISLPPVQVAFLELLLLLLGILLQVLPGSQKSLVTNPWNIWVCLAAKK